MTLEMIQRVNEEKSQWNNHNNKRIKAKPNELKKRLMGRDMYSIPLSVSFFTYIHIYVARQCIINEKQPKSK